MPTVCSSDECERPTHARGMCNFHYVQFKKTIAPECSAENCQKPSRARGLCHKHYDRELRAEAKDDIDYDDFWEFVKFKLKIGRSNWQPNLK
jgi:hypothetical protein